MKSVRTWLPILKPILNNLLKKEYMPDLSIYQYLRLWEYTNPVYDQQIIYLSATKGMKSTKSLAHSQKTSAWERAC